MMLGIMFLGSAVASTMILTKMTLAWLGGGEKGSFTANCGIKGALRQLFEEEARSSRLGLGKRGEEQLQIYLGRGGQTFPVWISSFSVLGGRHFQSEGRWCTSQGRENLTGGNGFMRHAIYSM